MSRAARAIQTTPTMKNEDLALDYEKSEDPAKITYSIPASRSSTWTKTQVLPRFLPRLRELLTKNPDQDLESCESRLSDTLNTDIPLSRSLSQTSRDLMVSSRAGRARGYHHYGSSG